MSQAWFAFALGLDPSSGRSVIDKFRQARSLPARRTGISDTMGTLPMSGDPIMTTGSLPPVCLQRAHRPPRGPINGSVDFDTRFHHGHELAPGGNLGLNPDSGDMHQNRSAGFDSRPQNSQGHFSMSHGPNVYSGDMCKATYVH